MFDTGPSLLTLPYVFEGLFAVAGEKLADHLTLHRLDPISRFVWPDGATFSLRGTAEETLNEVARFAPDDVERWRRFSAKGSHIWDLTADLFLHHAPEQVLRGSRLEPMKALRMILTPFRIGMFDTFARAVDRCIQSPRLREMLYQYATYSGASPFKAPATLSVIPHAEQHFGGWYPRGGMYAIAEALVKLATKVGVEIRTSCDVRRILVERAGKRRRVRGVELTGGMTIEADTVIANSDVVYTYRQLIEPEHRAHYPDTKLDRLEPGGSGMVLLLGVEGTYPQLAHHTKLMPADYRDDLRAMFDTHQLPSDPCIYVCATTRTDPTQAPNGCENLFILASAPAIDGSLDWKEAGPRYRDQLIASLERRGLTDLRQRIVVERCITPVDLRQLYNANAGSIYGIGSNSRKTAFLRPPNRDRDVGGLFFCGGATHPGGGLPLVALSGKIVSELVLGENEIEG